MTKCELCGEPMVYVDFEVLGTAFIERWYCAGCLVYERVIT